MSKKVLLGALALTAGVAAFATTSPDNDFQPVVDLLKNWATGTLGRVLSLAMFVVGIAAGIVQQSVMAAVAGVAGALVLNYGPNVIDTIFGALI